MRIEDYGLISDMQPAALVGRDGAVDWLCLPRFDSASCFSGWREWSGRCAYQGPYREAVLTSLIALRATTDETAGAVIAAPTTSLPEDLGGVRNWDYRYCWLPDPVLALRALLAAGYTDEALGRIEPSLWPRWRTVVEHVETIWREPDDGIWETRGQRRAVRIAERYYGSTELDASVLNILLVGFLAGDDQRVTGTIDAISRELGRDGFVSRHSTAETDDGLPGDEGEFLACSFWLVSALALNGRIDEARALFERLSGLSNDLGLLSEECDVPRSRQVGNLPQAFSHLTLIVATRAIAAADEGARRG